MGRGGDFADLSMFKRRSVFTRTQLGSLLLEDIPFQFSISSRCLTTFRKLWIWDRSNLYDHDAPCAVCFVKSRGSMLMIPAQNDCPSGWTEEYYGYLMTAYYYHANQKDYLCVDKDQEYVHDTE
ncbi:unnamed protein product [Porites lobata]|uniref:Uncharacterized protein n=1 Tax=Porites lobata TaxID=104759 RepID=A0ABN8P1B6_9CNID|nr:unnamed protein product [Porites lobata]